MGTWLAIAGVLLLLTAPLAEAQDSRPGNVTRVGALMVTSRQSAPDLWDAFRQGLRERGWVEGQILVIEERSAEGHVERSAKLAAELVRLKVDVIVAPNPWSARAAKSATTTIPIVMIVVDDPVGAGLVASLARPGATSLDSRRLWARRKSSANSWSCSRKPSQMSPASPC
jgi:putative ABC transport system substrate-binding protein